jgi:hypothetical protein
MTLGRAAAGIAAVLCLHASAGAEMFKIDNPAGKIDNPAGRIFNPATQINNPASNIYNPATRMNDPAPLSPPTQPVPQTVAPISTTEAATAVRPAKLVREQPQPRPAIPAKSYYFKTARAYITAAKKAFVRDDYPEFLSITEDALRRIDAGTLKASRKTRQKLNSYRGCGYVLLEKNGV